MNMKQLYYFYTIAEEGQITKAAKKLHMAQPPLSQSLQKFEQSLNTQLFTRHGRRLQLTAAGEILYKRAEQIFSMIDHTKQELLEVTEGIRGILPIGCVKSCFSYLPNEMSAFREQFPNVKFDLREGDSSFLAELLHTNEIQIAIVRLPIDLQDFHSIPLNPEKYVAVIPKEWGEFEEVDTITLETLAQYPLLLLHRMRGIGQYEIIVNQFDQIGLHPNILCESPNIDMLLGLVSENMGITIIPASSLLKFHKDNFIVLPISNMAIYSEPAVIWKKTNILSASTKYFIEQLTQQVIPQSALK